MYTPQLTIHTKALRHNAKLAQNTGQIIAVVKNNAYNFGLLQAVQNFYEAGITTFATTALSDCVTIRKRFKDVTIILLNPSTQFDTLRAFNIDTTLPSLSFLQTYYTQMQGISYHLEWAGLMRRSGCRSIKEMIITLQTALAHHIKVNGLWTHFAWADAFDDDNRYQHEKTKWLQIVDELTQLHTFQIIHAQNSASFVRENSLLPNHTHARLGIYLYGCLPYSNATVQLEHASTLSAQVLSLQTLHQNESVGYCNSFIATKNHTKIAILNIGYGDGLLRKRINGFHVRINNKLYPLVSLMMSHCVALVDNHVNINDTAIFYDSLLPVHYFTQQGVGANSEQISALNHYTLNTTYM